MTIDLGTIARTRREELGLLQKQVADMACCDRTTVRDFENNKRNVGIDHILSIFGVLGLRLVVEEDIQKQGEWVLLGKDDMDWYQTRACSECDCHWLGRTWEIPPKRCPNCGAYMRKITRRQNND